MEDPVVLLVHSCCMTRSSLTNFLMYLSIYINTTGNMRLVNLEQVLCLVSEADQDKLTEAGTTTMTVQCTAL